ncbi:LamG-like jellyroll fold domain-containing protein [Longimonas halophila]|nr:T9SS type A sorting domain-containing protein [Longimonas halophila]
MVLSTIALIVALGGAIPAQAQTVYHVTETGDASNSGASFAGGDALSLQGALSVATGNDVIVIATGRYLPTSNASDRDAHFDITGAQDGLKIYGGWTGTESFTDIGDVEDQLASRDLASNPTALSGDTDGNDNTNADGITENASDIVGRNSYTVLFLDGTNGGTITTDTVLDGLVITGGYANGFGDPSFRRGGGVFCNGDSSGNECSPQITNTIFAGNFADGFGGALANYGPRSGMSNPQIINSVFTGNSANSSGGAILNFGRDGTSSPQITNTVFAGNSADSNGGAIYNDAYRGRASLQITNTVFTANSADDDGGAIYNTGISGRITLVLTNSILWDNTGGGSGGVANDYSGFTTPTLSHTLVEGGCRNVPDSSCDNTNLDVDPLFGMADDPAGPDDSFGTEDDGLRLLSGSPALDAGDNTPFETGGVAEDATTDLLSEARIQGSTVSLGAYERGRSAARLRLTARSAVETGAIQLTNLGDTGVTDAQVNLDLPAGISVAGASGDGNVTDGTWTVDVPAEGTATVRVDYERGSSADPGLLNLTAELDTGSYTIDGSGTDGTDPGDATADWALLEAPYGSGTALAFDGTNDAATAEAHPDLAGNAPWTIAFWAKVDGSESGGDRQGWYLWKGPNSQSEDRLLGIVVKDGAIEVAHWANDNTYAAAVAFDMWQHVAVTYDGTGTEKVYLDGVFQDERDVGTLNINGGAWSLAQRPDGNRRLQVELDELRMWTEARTEADIQATMHQTIPADTPELVASYRFDAAQTSQRFDNSHSGTTAYDLTGGRDATFEGDPQWTASGAPLGQESIVVAPETEATIGADGQSLTATVTSTTDRLTLYRYGNATAEVFDDSALPSALTERANLVWGAANTAASSGVTADLELTYGDVTVPSPAVRFVGRPGPVANWTNRSADATVTGTTATFSDQTSFGEYGLSEQAIYHVNASATSGDNNGSSFADGFTDLQDALDVASGENVIAIAAGTYVPSKPLNGSSEARAATFEVTGEQDGLKIYGGWSGSETFADRADLESKLENRTLAANETILSGDIGTTGNASDNAYHVLVFNGGEKIGGDFSSSSITNATRLDGVTVTEGNANGSNPNNSGGGLYCDGQDNICSPTLSNTRFIGNTAGRSGGALYTVGFRGTSSPQITNAIFSGNTAGNEGGAIFNDGLFGTSSPQIANSTFANNSAGDGGALYNSGFSSGTSNPEITNSVFAGNSADRGGAMFSNGNGGTSSPKITNATFIGNSANMEGGALYNTGSGSASSPQVTNTILWRNTANNGDEIFNNSDATLTLTHTLIEGGIGGISENNGSTTTDGGNNLNTDPLFVDAEQPAGNDGTFRTSDDGLRLAAGSPAVDAGTNAPFESGGSAENVDTDLIGDARVQDADGDGTATVNMGAYETPGLPIATSVTIIGTDGTGTDAGWRVLSVPYDGAVAGDVRMASSEGTNAPRFNLNVMAVWDDSDSDESTGGTGAYITADASTPLGHGSAALLYLQDDTRNPVESSGLTVSLRESTAAMRHGTAPVVRNDLTQSARWHLLGNPYPTDYELSSLTTSGSALAGNGFQADAQVYDATTGSWKPLDTQTKTLAAWQGAFIERSSPGNGPTTVTFDPGGRTAPNAPFIGSAMQGPTAASSVERGTLWLEGVVTNASGNPVATDQAIGVRFHESATDGWDAWDTSKLAPLEAPSVTLSATGTGRGSTEASKAVESRPWPQDASNPDANLTAVPVAIRGNGLPDDGTLTLQVREWDLPDTWAAELIDTQGTSDTSDDQTVPLEPGMNYAVNVSSLTDTPETERFVVQIAPNTGALPVELARFEAQRSGDEAITVQWQTLSETNNAGFEVQRAAGSANESEDESTVETSQWGVSTGKSWQTIAHLEGAGTTGTPQSYRFEDTDLPYAADSLRYRLRQIDTDGTESFSEAVTIVRPVTEAELLPTYPNPARGQATVRFAVPERQDVRIDLYDLLGRRVQTVVDTDAEGRAEQPLDVSNLASGTYFLRMQTSGHTETQRVTVVR